MWVGPKRNRITAFKRILFNPFFCPCTFTSGPLEGRLCANQPDSATDKPDSTGRPAETTGDDRENTPRSGLLWFPFRPQKPRGKQRPTRSRGLQRSLQRELDLAR